MICESDIVSALKREFPFSYKCFGQLSGLLVMPRVKDLTLLRVGLFCLCARGIHVDIFLARKFHNFVHDLVS